MDRTVDKKKKKTHYKQIKGEEPNDRHDDISIHWEISLHMLYPFNLPFSWARWIQVASISIVTRSTKLWGPQSMKILFATELQVV